MTADTQQLDNYMRFEIGDRVKLTKKAVVDFYGKEERILDYCVGNDIDNLTSERFIQFVDDYGFNTGKTKGMVVGYSSKSCMRVLYPKVTGGYDYTYVEESDLKKV